MTDDYELQEMQQALRSLLALASMPAEKPVIEPADVLEAVSQLRRTLLEAKMASMAASPAPPAYVPDPLPQTAPPSFQPETLSATRSEGASLKSRAVDAGRRMLIAGELGIIIHQLKQSLSRMGADVTIVKDLFEATQIFDQNTFQVVILDANSEECFYTLEAIVENARQRNLEADIIVLIQPSKDNSFRQRCKNLGATVVLPKDEGWQTFIFEYLKAINF
ncbi:MAG: hypothetical protein VKJ04_09745 [Vampirovibrionales bacterium]|nr:hypothetical protein [Vampirovibrionales bacterium]